MSTQTSVAGVLEDPELVRMSTISSLSRTNDSTSTEWGPGTILGRVLLGFGEAVKDGFDNIIIRRRLNTLNSMFSHEQTLPSANVNQIYNDVLELSRCVCIVPFHISLTTNRCLQAWPLSCTD